MYTGIDKTIRRYVYRRDDYVCAVCGNPKHLQIHHIKPRGRGGQDESINLITLCMGCHAAVHGTKIAGYPMEKEDVEQAIAEYMADYYAEHYGRPWPNPWEGHSYYSGD